MELSCSFFYVLFHSMHDTKKKYEFIPSIFFRSMSVKRSEIVVNFKIYLDSSKLLMTADNRPRPEPGLFALKSVLKVHFCNGNFDQMLILTLLLILGKNTHSGKSMKNYFKRLLECLNQILLYMHLFMT